MNIFYVDNDPTVAAQSLCDKHVVKMILESAQIMCSVIGQTTQHFPDMEQPPYRITHKNHPCVIWAGLSPQNFEWLYDHAIALCDEYTYRYNRHHKSRTVIEWCGRHKITKLLDGLTRPALAMPDEYKDSDPVKAYRRYYNECKRNTIQMKWTRREPPTWWR